MGGDHAPQIVVDAAVDAVAAYKDLELVLYGDEAILYKLLSGKKTDRLSVVHAPQVIENNEAPVLAIRRKKDASVVVAMRDLAEGKGDGFVGAGSTGAVLSAATLLAKRMPGVQRPALAPLLPTLTDSQVLLIDCGANVDCKPEWLAQFAVMGSVYMSKVMGVHQPRVALLNNGVEEHKGDALAQEAYELLKKTPVNFVGNLEARETLSGDVDVIVCDGFVGNVALKSVEGTALVMSKMLKRELTSSLITKIGAAIVKPALNRFKSKLDYSEKGGALLLGITKAIIKAHGSSQKKAYYNAIIQCKEMADAEVPQMIEREIQHAL
ncbi:MAG: phosphate acyltransferase PlsX [Clostridia bacterium]|nr:phosphate acyltransferase PlsX [Clostridia bacterium]